MPNYPREIRRAAKRYGINPRIFLAQLRAESGGNLNTSAVSSKGARGIAQFIPSTAKQYGVNLNDGKASDDIDGAARYMRDNLARTGGNYHAALSIYNSGRPDGYRRIPETQAYVAKILAEAGGSPGATPTEGQGHRPGRIVTTPGVDRSSDRSALLLQYLQTKGRPGAFLALAQGIQGAQDTPSSSRRLPGDSSPAGAPTAHGTADFEGHEVAAWIKPALVYARKQGWKGQVNSGFRSRADQTRIYNSGVRPAAKPGTSNHEGADYPRGAVDVSDAQMLSNILKHSKFRKRLQYAGAKDPVHFSHPHSGSY